MLTACVFFVSVLFFIDHFGCLLNNLRLCVLSILCFEHCRLPPPHPITMFSLCLNNQSSAPLGNHRLVSDFNFGYHRFFRHIPTRRIRELFLYLLFLNFNQPDNAELNFILILLFFNYLYFLNLFYLWKYFFIQIFNLKIFQQKQN